MAFGPFPDISGQFFAERGYVDYRRTIAVTMLRFESCDLGQRCIDRPDTGGVPGICYANGQLIELRWAIVEAICSLVMGSGCQPRHRRPIPRRFIFVGKRSILSLKPLFCRSNQNFVGEKLFLSLNTYFCRSKDANGETTSDRERPG
jgi:hypothetical protein